MNNIAIDKNPYAFTIVELMVSITISVMLLGGIFYFMSDTILGISRSSAQSQFLKNFYGFTSILDSGNLEILRDYTGGGFDVGLLRAADGQSGVLIGVVDNNTLRLSPENQGNIYHDSILGYRSVSFTEIVSIDSDSTVIYDYIFFPDKVFDTFNIRDFQLQEFNSGALVEMRLDIFPLYNPNFTGQNWGEVPQDEIFTYGLVF